MRDFEKWDEETFGCLKGSLNWYHAEEVEEKHIMRMTSKSCFSFHADCPPFHWLCLEPKLPFLPLTFEGVDPQKYTPNQKLTNIYN